MAKELLYVIPAFKYKDNPEKIVKILEKNPEIKFVSLIGIDLAGNDTDEKIPVKLFINNISDFLNGSVVQTDGSSVVLTGIATLNDARVDFILDTSVNWFVDYNSEFIDEETEKAVGTLRIPSFLIHKGKRVDSRSLLQGTLKFVAEEMMSLLKKHKEKKISGLEHLKIDEIEEIIFTAGTELEFWVKTPAKKADISELSATQVIQENYWQRTRGKVRTALEQTMLQFEKYGLEPEMGHKEVGGVKAKIDSSGDLTHVMEQLEVDWKFSNALQAADNELQARNLVRECFRHNGLDVTFQAKPISKVAGSGEHTHVGIAAKMKSGSVVNLFSPQDMKENFLSAVGFGAIMGLLKNYEVVNPFITATNDAFNRLKPGFEAPICIVTSLGHNPSQPSRNRTVLAGLVRDVENSKSTRFEVRSPNPYTNTYITIAAIYLSMLDGIKATVTAQKDMKELEKELSKKAGEESFYLERAREYRSEEDVFEDFTKERRDQIFGKPPVTVWENMEAFEKYQEKTQVLLNGEVFSQEIIAAFKNAAVLRWKVELLNRIIPENYAYIISCKKLHEVEKANDFDLKNWEIIEKAKIYLAKDCFEQKSLFTRIKEFSEQGNFKEVSELQKEMAEKMEELKILYKQYSRNIL